MSELKCCPFCGGEAEMLNYSPTEWLVHCIECDGMVENWRKTKQEAIEQWNRRTPMANIVEKLEELKNEDVCMETSCTECKEKYKNNSKKDCYEPIQKLVLDKAINIVKQEINNGLE